MSRANGSRGPSLKRRATLLMPLALAGCGDWFGASKTPLPGVRLDVLPPSRTLTVDVKDTGPITLPPPRRNAEWPQVGGNIAHRMGSLAAGTSLTLAWRAPIGEGASYRRQLTAQPIVAGGSVFTMDAAGVVRAFRLADGGLLWHFDTKGKKDRSGQLGGGIAFDAGTLYAATGRAEVVAVDATKGVQRWRQVIGQPARAAPTIADGKLFIPTIAAQLLALDATDGRQIWSYQGQSAPVGILGEPSPAIGNGLVIQGFTSGELTALALASGTVQWSDNLGAVLGASSPANLSAVHALPVVAGSEVYAVSMGQLFVDEDIHSGRRVYYLEVAGSETPAVAGEWLFLLTIDQRLAAIQRHVGLVRWITPMPRFTDPKHEKGPILWQGPILAGGRLLLSSDRGELAAVQPESGKILERQRLPGPAAMAPVAADATVLVLLRNGTLTAWR